MTNLSPLSLLFPKLDPFNLGLLLALYEHRVAVQGFLFDVNSFDQFGVQLGKVLARTVALALYDATRAKALNSSTRNLLRKYRDHKRAMIEALAGPSG